ncbi:hypothetical protein Q8F55_003965 [Vanrija albida]|uniref:Palmitoyltransferase n=1 Tax=Vanrija albida TaxID=181172 RepID=A0ABR3Q684_9TREE
MRGMRLTTVLEQVIPPAILTYLALGLRAALTKVGYRYLYLYARRPWAAALYSAAVALALPALAGTFLRLYLLPSRQNVPPPRPPGAITSLRTLFECVPPRRALREGYTLVPRSAARDEVADALIATCHKGACAGRWKPARARHCSECGRCRCAFDHHCAFLANCITASYLPAFLALLFGTPLVVLGALVPVYTTLLARIPKAWAHSATDAAAARFWAWRPGWVVAGGPVGRLAVGLFLGWRGLDGVDGGGPGGTLTWDLAALAFVGHMLALLTTALGYSTLRHVLSGALTIDVERAKSLARLRADIKAKRARGEEPSADMVADAERFAATTWFFVPLEDSDEWAGAVLPALDGERPYDLGPAGNFAQIISRGRGISWLAPWNVLRGSLPDDELWNWPVAPAVRARLLADAESIAADEAEAGADY